MEIRSKSAKKNTKNKTLTSENLENIILMVDAWNLFETKYVYFDLARKLHHTNIFNISVPRDIFLFSTK